MFTEYAKTQFAQFPFYHQYEAMTVGADSLRVAEEILGTSAGDETVRVLHREMCDLAYRQNYVPVEYSAFAIRNATDADLFDVYLMDEDRNYVDSREGVMQEEAVSVAEVLMSAVRA